MPPLSDNESAQSRDGPACLNCGEPVPGAWCTACGQRRDQRPLGLAALLWELLVEVLDSDARVWRTLRTLLVRPGELTNAWVQGRRVAFMPPFRLYFVLNVLVFLVMTAQAPAPGDGLLLEGATAPDVAAAALEQRIAALDELDPDTPGLAGERQGLEQALAAVQRRQSLADGNQESATQGQLSFGGLEQWLVDIGYPEERVRGAISRGIDNPAETLEALYERLPAVMVLLLPLLATVMRGLYLFSRRPWVVHLVALVHLHAFFFLLILLVEGLQGFGLLLATLGLPAVADYLGDAVGVAAMLAAPLYLLRWVVTVYGHHWVAAVPIAAVVALLHLFGAMLGVIALVAGSLLVEVVFAG